MTSDWPTFCLSAAWYDYKSCAQACGGSGCVCEWRRKRPVSLPHRLSISWQRKATQWVRRWQTLVTIAVFSFLCVFLPSFHLSSFSSLCHLASVFGGWLHKSRAAFPPGEAREFNWKGDPEWKLPFLFRPLFCGGTEMYQGKEDEMYIGVSERNGSCS